MSATNEQLPGGGPFNASVAQALLRLRDQYGDGLFAQPQRLRSLLLDEVPQHKREIAALMQALDEDVPKDLSAGLVQEPIDTLISRLAARLTSQRALDPVAARWSVESWALALGAALPARAAASRPAALLDSQDSVSSKKHKGSEGGAGRSLQTDAALLLRRAADSIGRVAVYWRGQSRRNQLLMVAALAFFALIAGMNWVVNRPKIVIESVKVPERFIADGRRREALLHFKAVNMTPRSVDVRFVRGDGVWNPQSWRVNVPASAADTGIISLGGFSYTSRRPARVTFEYVIVTGDGRRSEPFEHTFEIEPMPATAPKITSLSIPSVLTVGRDFSATLGFEDPDGDVIKIERRVVSSDQAWVQDLYSIDAPNTSGKKSGNTSYQFQAAKVPSKSVIEFVLIDAAGLRSEPRQVQLDILAAPSGGSSAQVVRPPISPASNPQPQNEPVPAPARRPNCLPPAHLSIGDQLKWLQRNCMGVRR